MWSRQARLEPHPELPELPAIGWSRQNAAIGNILASHEHAQAFELVLVASGRLHWWVENERLTLSSGTLVCTRPGENHGSVDRILEPSEILWAQFRLDLNNAFGLGYAARKEVDSLLRNASRTGMATDHQRRHMTGMLEEIHRPQPRFWLIRAMAVCFMTEAAEALTEPAMPEPDPRIRAAIEHLRQNLGEKIAIPALAKTVGLSESWFHQLFRQGTGLSAADWISRERIERAKDLLGNSELSVTEIAHELGFSSSQYFATSFRKQTGVPPSSWRSSNS